MNRLLTGWHDTSTVEVSCHDSGERSDGRTATTAAEPTSAAARARPSGTAAKRRDYSHEQGATSCRAAKGHSGANGIGCETHRTRSDASAERS
jgi:hypothetical protein